MRQAELQERTINRLYRVLEAEGRGLTKIPGKLFSPLPVEVVMERIDKVVRTYSPGVYFTTKEVAEKADVPGQCVRIVFARNLGNGVVRVKFGLWRRGYRQLLTYAECHDNLTRKAGGIELQLV